MTLKQLEEQIRLHRSLMGTGTVEQEEEHHKQILALKALARPFWEAERNAREDKSAMCATYGY